MIQWDVLNYTAVSTLEGQSQAFLGKIVFQMLWLGKQSQLGTFWNDKKAISLGWDLKHPLTRANQTIVAYWAYFYYSFCFEKFFCFIIIFNYNFCFEIKIRDFSFLNFPFALCAYHVGCYLVVFNFIKRQSSVVCSWKWQTATPKSLPPAASLLDTRKCTQSLFQYVIIRWMIRSEA